MEKKEMITDEELAQYFSGNTPAEEEQEILDKITNSDWETDDLIAIATALKKQKEAEQPKPKTMYYRVAAAIALLVVAGGVVFRITKMQDSDQELIAMNNTTQGMSVNPTEVHEIIEENSSDMQQVKQHYREDHNNATNSTQPKKRLLFPSYHQSPIIRNNTSLGNGEGGTTYQAAYSHSVGEDQPSDVQHVSNILKCSFADEWHKGKTFMFTWESNAVSVELRLKPTMSNEWNYKKKYPAEQRMDTLSSALWDTYRSQGLSLDWEMKAHYEESGQTMLRKGTIYLRK